MQSSPSYRVFNQTSGEICFSENDLEALVKSIEANEKCHFNLIEVVFVSEDEILKINRHYLKHDYVTDIITFPYEENRDSLEGTLYCCYPKILEQAKAFSIPVQREAMRIVIHGLLHLAGFNDKTKEEKETMRLKEDFYLELFFNEVI
ncbi:rRNA maturation RNase YbeY [Balneolaceae bacterium ANBcel3]|nr:rRNA maturation RNase YbeY [Balneolaceae bacterium ANBcel3]